MGSASDADKVQPCLDILHKLNLEFSVHVCSAHRTPEKLPVIVQQEEAAHAKVFICAAGMAAHLAGAVAARTLLPVIGIPLSSASLGGMDALFSTVQMPPGIPVATVALDSAGAKNAAWLAAQIIALNDDKLRERLLAEREQMAKTVEKANTEIRSKFI